MSEKVDNQGKEDPLGEVVTGGELVWDEYHCNPRAEVVLVSNDMVGFRVEAWYIKKKSDFIRDLLEIPSTQSIADAPIHLDQDSDTVRHFVDYVTIAKDHNPFLSLIGFQHLLDLCDHLQAPAVEVAVLAAMKARMDHKDYPTDFNAWEVFALAARRDNEALAKCAISCFGRSRINLIGIIAKQPPAFFDNVPSRYFHALLRSFVYQTTAYETRKGYGMDCLAFRRDDQAAEGFALD